MLLASLMPNCNRSTIPKIDQQQATEQQIQPFVFPNDWLGYWQGDLKIYNVDGLQQTIPMALDNAKTYNDSAFTWAIIYGADTIAGRRDYQLEVVDASKGHYRVDEKNGIILDAYLINDELVSVFDIMGNTLTSTYRRVGTTMEFTIMMYKSDAISTTGDTLYGEEQIPQVNTYKPIVTQKATLHQRSD